MSNTSNPKVIFVDGFNTVGKDYFIEALAKELTEKYGKKVLHSDPRVWLPQFQANKRYWDFMVRPLDETLSIIEAHYHQLRSIRQRLDEPFTSDCVIISNRSFVTAINYNLNKQSHNGKYIGGDEELRDGEIERYKKIFHSQFAVGETVMVNLSSFHDKRVGDTQIDYIQELRRRMKQRDSSVMMNDYYLDYLIHEYRNPSKQVKSIYGDWIDACSSDASAIAKELFEHEKETTNPYE